MSDTYDSESAASSYNSARELPGQTVVLWMSQLTGVVPKGLVKRIVDLGGGTGRFAPALQRAYGCEVIVVDRSQAMLRAGTDLRTSMISWVCASAEHLPLADSATEMVWMSQVYHHVDKVATCREAQRILSPSGYLVIRNGTLESDAELEWIGCFPEAQALGRKKIPSRDELINTVCECGFKMHVVSRVRQLFASSWQEHFDKISKRGLSGLLEISDEAFEEGLARFKTWIENKPKDQPVFEPVDFFVFEKTVLQ